MAVEDSVTAIARLTAELEALRATGVLDDDTRIRDRLTAIEAHNARMRESVELQEKRNRLLQIELDLLEKNKSFYKEKNESLDAFIRKEKIELDLNEDFGQKKLFELRKEAELKEANRETDEEAYQLALDALAEAQKRYTIREKELEIAKQIGDETKKMLGSTFGISTKWKDTIWGKLGDKESDFKTNITAIGKSFSDTFTGANIAGSLLFKGIEETMKAFTQYDAASASIAKVAGDNERLQNVLQNTARGATAYGISFAEAGKAIEGLYTELNTFSTLSQKVQEQLTVSTAKLEKLGISSQQSAKQIATLTQIMGMTEVQAGKTAEQLAGFALAIGKSPQQVASDFAGASDRLGAYGNKMIDVFKNLETQSKGTGVALNDLLSLTEKFQTFEGAASAAGKLNAALGGGFVNAMELLEASSEDPSKAIDLLRTRLNDAGLAFDQLSFYEKKLIADAGGFKTVEEASRILSMTNAEAERAAKADAERAAQQELVNDAIQRSIPIQQKLELIMANLAIAMGPVVEVISDLFSLFAMFVDSTIGKVIIGILVAIGIAALATSSPLLAIAAAIYGVAKAFEWLHDTLLVPHSPVLFDSLLSMPKIFGGMASSLGGFDGQLNGTLNNFEKFEKSSKSIASSLETLPESISFTTPQLGKLNSNMEVTNKITDATKQSVDVINNLNTDKAKMLVNVMSPQTPNVTVTPTINQPAPEVKVYLGNEPVKNIVNKVMNGGSNLAPQTLGVPIR